MKKYYAPVLEAVDLTHTADVMLESDVEMDMGEEEEEE